MEVVHNLVVVAHHMVAVELLVEVDIDWESLAVADLDRAHHWLKLVEL